MGYLRGGEEAPARPKVPYNRQDLMDPDRIAAVRRRLECAPQIGWATDVDTHAAELVSFLLQTLAEVCPPHGRTEAEGLDPRRLLAASQGQS